MAHELPPPSAVSAEPAVAALPPAPAHRGARPAPKSGLRRLGVVFGILAAAGLGTWLVVAKGWPLPRPLGPGAGQARAESKPENGEEAALPVNTVRPTRKTLERVLVQPGTVKPWAQAELYAKVSGYLKAVRRDGAGPGQQIDIGSTVRAGDVLLEIASPERLQDVTERETVVRQREAEREAARTALATLEATVAAAQAQKGKAEADVRKHRSDLAFRGKELERINALVRDRTVTAEIADEKQQQVHAAQAALDSGAAQVQVVQADLAVVSSKLTTARADLKVKEVLVQVARDQLQSARIQAEYALVRAPFEGLVTYRGVDEGDFVQNATSGQARLLMTVTALDKVKVVLHVREQDAVWVDVGAEATLEVDARGSWRGKGCVARVGHVLDPQSRTMQVEIDLDNPGHRLKPGMYGQVTLALQKIPNALALPATAVYSRKGVNYLLRVVNGRVCRQPVRLRYDDGKEVEVVQLRDGQEIPLDGSEEVVVSNKGEMREGQRVAPTRLPPE